MLASHQTVKLSPGRHRSPEVGVCVMELASMLAGEPMSDHPKSVAPTVASVLRACNDGLDDRRRQGLKRFASASVGTVATRRAEKERRRLLQAWLATDDAPGWGAALLRRLDSSYPSARIHETCQRIAGQDDEDLHHRLLSLLDELVGVGRDADDDGVLCASDLPASSHPRDKPTTPGGSPHDHRC